MTHLPPTLPGGLSEGWQSRVLNLCTDAAAMDWPATHPSTLRSPNRQDDPLSTAGRRSICSCPVHLWLAAVCRAGSALLCPACKAVGIAQLVIGLRLRRTASPLQPAGGGSRWPGAPKCLPSLLEPRALQQNPQGRQSLAAHIPAPLRRRRTSGVRRMLLTRVGQARA